MKNDKTTKLVQAALFAALVFVTTFIIKIPTLGTGGYIHPGDAFVILSGLFLGPIYGSLAAAIGSMLSDLVGGYVLYAPVTFLIKGLVAALAGLTYSKWGKSIRNTYLRAGLSGLWDLLLVVPGYLAFEAVIYGAAALASVPGNLIQAIGGLIIAVILFPLLSRLQKNL